MKSAFRIIFCLVGLLALASYNGASEKDSPAKTTPADNFATSECRYSITQNGCQGCPGWTSEQCWSGSDYATCSESSYDPWDCTGPCYDANATGCPGGLGLVALEEEEEEEEEE